MAGPQLGVYDESFFNFFPEEMAGAGGWSLENVHNAAYSWVLHRRIRRILTYDTLILRYA